MGSGKLCCMTGKLCHVILEILLLVTQVSSKEIKIGLLIPSTGPNSFNTTAAAASLAVEAAQRRGMVAGYTFKFVWKDDQNSQSVAAGRTAELQREGVNVVIGPPDGEVAAASALTSAYWNLPHISWGGTDPKITNKTEYNTLIQITGGYGQLGGSYHGIVHKFKWRTMAVLARGPRDGDIPVCKYVASTIQREFILMSTRHTYTLSEFIQYNPDKLTTKAIDVYLNRLKQRARVIALCGLDDEERKILLRAKALGMTDGEYAFFIPRTYYTGSLKPWYRGDSMDEEARLAYMAAFLVTFVDSTSRHTKDFKKQVPLRMADPPWSNTYAKDNGLPASRFSPFLYDAVYMYMLALNKSGDYNITDINDGRAMFNMMKSFVIPGMSGTVHFDRNGDRNPDFWVWGLRNSTLFEPVALVDTTETAVEEVTILQRPVWFLNNNKMPPDTPPCGFQNEHCQKFALSKAAVAIIVLSVLALSSLAVALTYHVLKQKRFEAEILKKSWHVDCDAVVSFKTQKWRTSMSKASVNDGNFASSAVSIHSDRLYNNCFVYKGSKVIMHMLNCTRFELKRHHLVELQLMRDMVHDNINSFVGASLQSPNFCLVFAFCEKGSLEEILDNTDISLDWIFRCSFISDLTAGMSYLHNSKLKSHGRLKSSNCVVDNRWVLKVTDFGPTEIISLKQHCGDEYHDQLWTAPEFFRTEKPERGSQAGDVYSFGIILHEIVFREGVFGDSGPAEETMRRIRNEGFRPSTRVNSEVKVKNENYMEVIELMKLCWREYPQTRPTFAVISGTIKKINQGRRNIVENMIELLEKYANNLEKLVEQRTNELFMEKRKTETLLYEMLPQSIADCLKVGQQVEPRYHSRVTVFFSDIVGFTRISSSSTPLQIVNFLNDLYTMFDDIINNYNVYKMIETIGDAYMVASGVPEDIEDHLQQIANMALEILNAVPSFTIRHCPQERLTVRIGIHTGSCCAGVIGLKRPKYCLFGDAINTASRMESTGEGMRIQMSEPTNKALQNLGGYVTELRGDVEIKGKGIMKTYWLIKKVPQCEIID